MTVLDRLERRFGGLAIKNLTLWIIIGQVVVYGLISLGNFPPERLTLIPGLVLQGEVWRVFTFLFFPPSSSPIFLLIAWYVFFMLGRALEGTWGEFRFNLFIFVGALATIAASFAAPDQVATNAFLATSVFLAFAYLFPNFEFLLFFVLPVKVKWLAALTWALYAFEFIGGTASNRLMVLAATANFFLFFGGEILRRGKAAKRRQVYEQKQRVEAEKPFHLCCICGATDKTKPDDQFYYRDGRGYCESHVTLMDQPEADQLSAAGGTFKE
ncbi:hypothetical protein H5P28_14595 [Ruficoccus amylovorans]|uniref:Peptidase S54 rhomboid domain-containing protein n=1 Tax=Ruficoccus amylovorans TaxID=1804625 RepID=A0A842HGE7_9BACT|nr:hypothetical protein [Ruficoccus amylovorans]MBC2595492.1 hypothetical protein [Ruficoccus amylovorans]